MQLKKATDSCVLLIYFSNIATALAEIGYTRSKWLKWTLLLARLHYLCIVEITDKNTRVFDILADEPRKFIDDKRVQTLSQGVVHTYTWCICYVWWLLA